MDTGKSQYDAMGDATTLAAPLRKWARIGFLRGFSGVRKEILPMGAMILPSKAFGDVAWESLNSISHEGEEYEARHRYVLEVEEILRQRQSQFVEDHYRNSVWGHICDFLLALVFVGLMIGLLTSVGPLSPLTIGLLSLIGIKIIFLHVSVRRAIRIAQSAFQFSRDDIKLPWDAGATR
ncbi:hypothetical protein [Rhizobium sp. BK176]|uniref:hypothetical protein n=1 Tax=Rhizobium sp. BK176 TaxID=2587071 RepID=UPI002166E729|nr:hypothetical protein [Rhizobium sp. BK176]MCS4088416.1 hypothetical protein [Rhizobium sp. BK176]